MASRVYAIGDLHADPDCARYWIRRTGLVANFSASHASSWRWTDPSAHLIFLGDLIDKGQRPREVLELVRRVQLTFPDRVTVLMGNHELNLILDGLRHAGEGHYFDHTYGVAHPRQYLDWLDDPQDADAVKAVAALHDALNELYAEQSYPRFSMTPDGPTSIVARVEPASLRPMVSRELRRWQDAYLAAVHPSSPLGAWLGALNVTAHLAGSLFVHGGVSPELVASRADARDYLVDGLLNRRWRSVGASAAALDHALLSDASSLVEYRGLHDPRQGCQRVERILAALSTSATDDGGRGGAARRDPVERIAVGHTPGLEVRVRCGGRLLALDSSLGRDFRAYGNMYCDSTRVAEPRVRRGDPAGGCAPRARGGTRAVCEGQIVRFERTATRGGAGRGARVLHAPTPAELQEEAARFEVVGEAADAPFEWSVHVMDSSGTGGDGNDQESDDAEAEEEGGGEGKKVEL